MSITLPGSGPYDFNCVSGIHSQTSYGTYSFCSSIINTTAAYDGNVLDFGTALGMLWIMNGSANALAFQFPEFYGTSKDSGIVLGNDKIWIPRLNKRGMKLRSADPAAAAICYVWGI